MNSPKVSIIIPAYNQGEYLPETLSSILNQTHKNIEVIVVNDASTDNTEQVVRRFDDPRLRYIVHEKNRYAAAARNTGIKASTGDLIAFLDADDIVFPEKIEIQAAFLTQNPDVGLTYNSRIEIDSFGKPLNIVLPPPVVNLSNLVLTYPYAPSEVVVRRDWIERVGLFDEGFVFSGEDPDLFMRLSLQGCKMMGIDKILNYRRLHASRVIRNLQNVVDDQIRAFENTFSNPLCPPEVLKLRKESLGQLHLILSYDAFFQSDTVLGQNLLCRALEFIPSILDNSGSELLEFFVGSSTRVGDDHEEVLKRIFAQLPPEIGWLKGHFEASVGYGYFLRGTRDIIWGRTEVGAAALHKAHELKFMVDEGHLRSVMTHLLNYNAEFGAQSCKVVLRYMIPPLSELTGWKGEKWFRELFLLDSGFKYYNLGDYGKVVENLLLVLLMDPSRITNRGIMSVLFRSIVSTVIQRLAVVVRLITNASPALLGERVK